MNLITSILQWIDFFFKWAWPVIITLDFWLRGWDPHCRRMQRGKWRAWEARTFGPLGHSLMLLFVASASLAGVAASGERWPIDFYWGYILLAMVVDFITGGEDQGKRFKAWASSKVKKLKISPPPRPAIDLRMEASWKSGSQP